MGGVSGADIPLPAFAKKFLLLFIFLSDRRDLMLQKVKVAAKKDSILISAVFFFVFFYQLHFTSAAWLAAQCQRVLKDTQ